MVLGTYLLSELDEAELNEMYVGNRLKRFFYRQGIELDGAEEPLDNRLEEVVEEEIEKEKND